MNRGSHDLSFYLFNDERSELKKEKFTSIKLNGSSNIRGRFRDLFPLVKNVLKEDLQKEDLDFPMQFAFLHLNKGLRFYEG